MTPAPYRTDHRQHADGIFTAYNLWYEVPDRMYCLNYTRGTMIPAGSEVTGLDSFQRAFKPNPALRFNLAGVRGYFDIYFAAKYHPGLDFTRFFNRLFVGQPFSELTRGLSLRELEAIRRGQIVKGMSKRAVLIALGYPPEHRTPQLESQTWIYWPSRFKKQRVLFNAQGKTMRLTAPRRPVSRR
jgi:hypothetical protein